MHLWHSGQVAMIWIQSELRITALIGDITMIGPVC